MQTKKLASVLAFTAVAVNMVASVALAQPQPVGTQILDCSNPKEFAFSDSTAYHPDDFHIGTGTRSISNSNDTSATEELNSAYFDETTSGTFTDITDQIKVESTTPYVCDSGTYAVQLDVDATNFVNGTSEPLLTYGADRAVGGTGADEDYYAMLSIVTSGTMACTSPCVLVTGAAESANLIKDGESNFFLNAAPNDKQLNASFDNDAVLIKNDGTTNTVTLYSNDLGFDGSITVPGLDYVLAMPAYPAFLGTFTSNVTYTLS